MTCCNNRPALTAACCNTGEVDGLTGVGIEALYTKIESGKVLMRNLLKILEDNNLDYTITQTEHNGAFSVMNSDVRNANMWLNLP